MATTTTDAQHGSGISYSTISGARKDGGGGTPNSAELSGLERMPAEVRRQILFTVPFEDLGSMVKASPVFYQQFLLDRSHILRSSVAVTLGPLVVDACAVQSTSSADFALSKTNKTLIAFSQTYQQRCRSCRAHDEPGQSLIFDQRFSDQELLGMVRFHFDVVQPLAQPYAEWAWTNFDHTAAMHATADKAKKRGKDKSKVRSNGGKEGERSSSTYSTGHRDPLSATEELRVMRGLYRFQLYCNIFTEAGRLGLFADNGFEDHFLWCFEKEEILHYFICLFEPWEVEELLCIQTFVEESYSRIFDDICWDVHPHNPRFKREVTDTRRDRSFDLRRTSNNRDFLLSGTSCRGLRLLRTVLLDIDDHRALVETMERNITSLAYNRLDIALEWGTQYLRRDWWHSDRDLRERNQEPQPFLGDIIDDPGGGPGNEHPPLSWTLLWRGTYSNLYGYCLTEPLQDWGYIFWDADRMEKMDAKQLLLRQWNARWHGQDAREFVF